MRFFKYSSRLPKKQTRKNSSRKKNGRVFLSRKKSQKLRKKFVFLTKNFIPKRYSFRLISAKKEDELLGVLKAEVKVVKKFIPGRYSFQLVSHKKEDELLSGSQENNYQEIENKKVSDERRRLFLKTVGIVGAGAVGATLLPKKAEALVMGATPATSVVGLKDENNLRINPATEETLASLPNGKIIYKKTISLTESGTVHTPASGKKIRLYSMRFTLTANMTDVGYRFTSGGTDFEKYLYPRAGGMYGSNSHPNYIEGGVNEVLHCVITGTGTVQTVIIYDEV